MYGTGKINLTVEEEQDRLRQAIDFTLLDLMTLTAKAEASGLDDIAANLFWSPYTVR
ncbi:dihydroxyacetone kinase subunit M [Escherichia coli]|nr:dihydroxyacetone kinase subunit M [Escherichia coli]